MRVRLAMTLALAAMVALLVAPSVASAHGTAYLPTNGTVEKTLGYRGKTMSFHWEFPVHHANGKPVRNLRVLVEYTVPSGNTYSRWVRTDNDGYAKIAFGFVIQGTYHLHVVDVKYHHFNPDQANAFRSVSVH